MSEDEKRVQIGAAWECVRECRPTAACWERKVSVMLEPIPRQLDMHSVGVDRKWRLSAHGQALSEWPIQPPVRLRARVARLLVRRGETSR